MDKVEIIRETQDFMNVESFSQLPFIRPAPPANKEKGAIRLFGIEFGAAGDETEPKDNNAVCDNGKEDEVDKMMVKNNSGNNIKSIVGGSDNESNRRFECHYCCRNFPTSQALGGHQNAHKRERQHAKREHLQSAMVHGGLVSHEAAHVYGLMNYSRHLAGSSPALHHHHHPTYPSWNTNTSTTSSSPRFYGSSAGSYGTQSAPINGSPLGLWRIPSTAVQTSSNPNNSFNRDRSLLNPIVTPLFAGEEMKPLVVTGSANPLSLSQSRFVYESSSVQQDHVSLDLHL